MLRNNIYNLMNQIVQESKSLWRIEKEYMQEAVGNDALMAVWKKLEKDKTDSIEQMQVELKKLTQ